MEKPSKLIMVIFGGTGNLAKKKLIPTIFDLYKKNKLSDNFCVISIGRKNIDTSTYHQDIKKYIDENADFDSETDWARFKEIVTYYQMNFEDQDSYKTLKEELYRLDQKYNSDGNRLYYLATSANYFETISLNLKKQNMVENKLSWQKIMIEKPFGYDLESARKLNKALSESFNEDYIYRIDHYLAKEMIQNIIYIRFTNKIFDAIWNGNCIDNIQITVSEKMGIEARGGYYDKSGALRDMVQNHLFQILALVTMERPKSFDTEDLRNEKVKLLKSIRPYTKEEIKENVILGQYISDGKKLGYKEEEDVDNDSITETFVGLKLYIDNERWKDTPIYLKTGKRLSKKEAYITIQFKNSDFESGLLKECVCDNILGIRIQPMEGIYLKFNMKQPGHINDIKSVETDYCQSCDFNYKSIEAYEKLIIDAISGDKTLFTRWDEVECSWMFIDKLTELCCDERKDMLEYYESGSTGPKAFDCLIEKDLKRWWRY